MNRYFLLSLFLILSACASRPEFSESTYTVGEVGQIKSIVRCEVLAVREIAIRDPEGSESGEALGLLGGAVLGSALGGTVGGDDNDQALGAAVGGIAGAIGGAYLGEQIGESRSTRKGLEYSILTVEGEELTLAQEFLQGDRVINPGEDCRLQVAGSRNRVLPTLR